MEDEFVDAVRDASNRADVREAVEDCYRLVADATAIRKPICTASGRCCRFEEYGHRLYLTTMELAKFVADLGARASSPALEVEERASTALPDARAKPSVRPIDSVRSLPILAAPSGEPDHTSAWNGRGCPFQIDGLCGVHAIRPFGCRIFFCDPTSVDWQHDQYELHHGRLRKLHDELCVPYHYVEWRFALKTLGLIAGENR